VLGYPRVPSGLGTLRPVIAVLAVCLAIAVVAVVWLAARSATIAKQLATATERATALEAEASSAKEEARAIGAERDEATAQLSSSQEQAQRAEYARLALQGQLEAERRRAEDADARAREADLALDQVRAERDDARSQLVETGWGHGAGPDTLWALELARTERTWRTSVAADPTSDVFDPGADALRTAVLTDVAAAREDAGVEVVVVWELVDQLDPLAALAVLRSAQELVAGATRIADEVRLVVEPDGDDVVVHLTEPDGSVGRYTSVAVVKEGRGLVPSPGGVRIVGAVTRQPA
jgi:hypothetical protein